MIVDATLIGKWIAFSGLALDIIGAWCLYQFAFKRPRKLIETAFLPREEIIGGQFKMTTPSMILSFDAQARAINLFNEFQDVLFGKRVKLGFWFLGVGFAFQGLGNFVGIYIDAEPAWIVALLVVVALVACWCYLFKYVRDVSEIEYDPARKVELQLGKTNELVWESDAQFQTSMQKLKTERKKLGLS